MVRSLAPKVLAVATVVACMLPGCSAAEADLLDCFEQGDGGQICREAANSPASDLGAPPENEPGDGDADEEIDSLSDDFFDTCTALVTKACGAGGSTTCEVSPGCRAARLTADYEREECESALANEVAFPACQASSCEVLVEKVCGEGGSAGDCSHLGSCGPALDLRDRSENAASAQDRDEVEGACAAGLADEAVFAPCGGS